MEERDATRPLLSSPSYLIVRFSAIGDCVMASYAATAIRNKYPDAEITWACESRCQPVLDTEKLVTRVVSFPRERWKKNRWSIQTWREQLHTYSRMRRLKFDYGVDLQGHTKTAMCLRIANPKVRVAANATDHLSAVLNPVPARRQPGTHMVDWAMATIQRLGEFEMPSQPIMPNVSGIEIPGLPEAPFVAISLGAGQKANLVPEEHWTSVARDLMAQGIPVVTIGGSEVAYQAPEGVINLVGKHKLRDTMAVIARSAVHIGADTGTGHIAAAYQVPTVSVFAFADPREFRPYSDKGIVLQDAPLASNVPPSAILEATLRQLDRA